MLGVKCFEQARLGGRRCEGRTTTYGAAFTILPLHLPVDRVFCRINSRYVSRRPTNPAATCRIWPMVSWGCALWWSAASLA